MPPPRLTPERLADRTERCIAAVEPDGRVPNPAQEFATWLAGHWTPERVAAPVMPAAVTHDRRGGAVIEWHAVGETIIGRVPGASGHYAVRTDEEAPHVPETFKARGRLTGPLGVGVRRACAAD